MAFGVHARSGRSRRRTTALHHMETFSFFCGAFRWRSSMYRTAHVILNQALQSNACGDVLRERRQYEIFSARPRSSSKGRKKAQLEKFFFHRFLFVCSIVARYRIKMMAHTTNANVLELEEIVSPSLCDCRRSLSSLSITLFI